MGSEPGLSHVTLAELVVVLGPSGSGKSTLLSLIAGLEVPDGGSVSVAGQPLASLSESELARLRRRAVAVVFQFFNLLPMLTAEQNVGLPLRADGRKRGEIAERVGRALEPSGSVPARITIRTSCPAVRCSASLWRAH